MDDKFYIKGNGFSIRIHDPEEDLFTFNNPNPHWKDLGKAWLKIALDKESLLKVKGWIDVACLPSSHFRITRINTEDNILPTKWDLHELPNASNFVIMKNNGFFRIQGSYLGCDRGFIGDTKNVEFDPFTDSDLILTLLRVAKKIHSP